MRSDLSLYQTRKVVVVDGDDREKGEVGIIEAHRGEGILHRALSVCLYRWREGKREWLIQRRSQQKIVFGGKWANSCCYNLAPGESYREGAVKRVKEELGMDVEGEKLVRKGRFEYFARDKNGWCEREVDTVWVGEVTGEVELRLNPQEVAEAKWVGEDELVRWLVRKPEEWGPWVKQVWELARR